MTDFLSNIFGGLLGGGPTTTNENAAVPEWVLLDETLQVRFNAPPPPTKPISAEVQRATGVNMPVNTPPRDFQGEMDVPQGGYPTASNLDPSRLGTVSARYESGGRGVGFISSGKDDPGGQSYGVHQLSSKDSMPAFLRSPEGKPFAARFAGQSVGTKAFNDTYRSLAKEQANDFEAAQHAYYSRTHYKPLEGVAAAAGFDIKNRGVQEALFSMAIQHGRAAQIVKAAKIAGASSPEQQIRALYAARTEYVRGLTSLPPNTKASVLKRYEREIEDALSLR